MSVKCIEIVEEIEKKYPLSLAEDYDNSGLIIGDYEKTIKKILFCLDITNEIINEAIEENVDMIISHHPIIFNPVKKIVNNDYISSMIIRLIRAGINVYALHTNFDNAQDGMNDILAKIIGLDEVKPLSSNKTIKLYKLVVFVPSSHHNMVLNAILNAGAGYIGNYSHCSFNSVGEGTFMPHEGTSPFIGEKGKLEIVNETKIETVVKDPDLKDVIAEILKVHPYEEVAYDVYPLNNIIENGTGRVGRLKASMCFKEFCSFIKEKLCISTISAAGNPEKEITKVSIVGGAGSDFIDDCLHYGCDVLITGDVKHHEALDAINNGLNIIDAGHYSLEILGLVFIKDFIGSLFDVECKITKVNTDPFAKI